MAYKITYKITGILTLYRVTTENVIYVAINGDIKSPDGKRNLFFKYDESVNEYGDCAKMLGVDKTFTIHDRLERVISLLFSNKQKATFEVSFLVKDGDCRNINKDTIGIIEGVEIKQP